VSFIEGNSTITYNEANAGTGWTTDVYSANSRRKVLAKRIIDNATGTNNVTFTILSGTATWGVAWASYA
jgi:hypothetical protein